MLFRIPLFFIKDRPVPLNMSEDCMNLYASGYNASTKYGPVSMGPLK